MKKNNTFSFRLTEEEARNLRSTAKQKKMSLSSLIAQCCLHNDDEMQTQNSFIILTNTLQKSLPNLKNGCLTTDEFIKRMEDVLNEVNN